MEEAAAGRRRGPRAGGRARRGALWAAALAAALAGAAGRPEAGAALAGAGAGAGPAGEGARRVDLGAGLSAEVLPGPPAGGAGRAGVRVCVGAPAAGEGGGGAAGARVCLGGAPGAGPFRGAGWGRWVGASLQRFIYEGYSLRPGLLVSWEAAAAAGWEAAPGEGSGGCGDGRVLRVRLEGRGATGLLEVGRLAAEDLPPGASLEAPAVRVRLSAAPRAGSWRTRLLPRLNRVGLALDAAAGEGFYGMGERFSAVDQAGQKLYCWAEDGGWGFGTRLRLPKGKESTYSPVPFYVSSEGHGVWLNTTRRTDWDFRGAAPRGSGGGSSSGSKAGGTLAWEVEGLEAEMVLILGASPAETLHGFAGLTGRPLIPPKFQFGPWNQFGSELAASGLSAVQQARAFVEMDIPSSVAIIPRHFTPLGVPSGARARLRSQVAQLKALGLPALAYFNSMLATSYPEAYHRAQERGLFAKDQRTNRTWQFDYKGAGPEPFRVSLLDVSNPEARTFFQGLMREATEVGFNGWMYDYGEYVDPLMRFHGGVSGAEMHNRYPVLYQEVAHDFFTTPDPASGVFPAPGEGHAPPHIFYVRSGYTGTGGRTWAQWTGDPYSDWSANSGIKAQVKASLSAGLAGVAFSGSDIGGFVWMEPPSLELWVRWAQLGSLSGLMHMQTEGTSLLGNPKTHIHDWPEGTAIYRRWAKFRTALFPYLYGAAHEARSKSLPLMRHHVLSFPSDREATAQEYQYLLGPDLLAAPVLDDGRRAQRVYLPAGGDGRAATSWTDFTSHVLYDADTGRHRMQHSRPRAGGQWVSVPAALEQAPLFVRASAVLFTLDPGVHTLAAATAPEVRDLDSLGHLLHAWLFPDAGLRAAGSSWDGARIDLAASSACGGAGGPMHALEATLTVSDALSRNLVVQLPIPPVDPASISLSSGAAPDFPRREHWSATAGTAASEDWAWAYDVAASVVWVRVPSGPEATSVRLSAECRPKAP